MKKPRLFFSIASLCMALAILMFGVYAATSITYTVSATISYEVTDVYVTLTAKVYKITAQTTSDSCSTFKTALSAATIASTYTQVGDAQTSSNPSSNVTHSFTNLAFNTTDAGTYIIFAKIQNNGANAISVTVGNFSANPTNVSKFKSGNITTINGGATDYVVISYSPTSFAAAVASTAVSVPLTIADK